MSLDDKTFASLTETRVSAPHKIAEALAGRRRRQTLDPRRDAVHRRRRPHGAGDGRPLRRPAGDGRSSLDARSAADRARTPASRRRAGQRRDHRRPRLARRAARQGRRRNDEPRRSGRRQLDASTTASPPTTLRTCSAANLDAGKLLLRIDYHDAGTVPTLAERGASGAGAQRRADDGHGRADPVHQERQG